MDIIKLHSLKKAIHTAMEMGDWQLAMSIIAKLYTCLDIPENFADGNTIYPIKRFTLFFFDMVYIIDNSGDVIWDCELTPGEGEELYPVTQKGGFTKSILTKTPKSVVFVFHKDQFSIQILKRRKKQRIQRPENTSRIAAKIFAETLEAYVNPNDLPLSKISE